MSSHHFVKEGQEPALVIAANVPYELVEPLLQWSPFIIVLQTAFEKVLSWGIRIDVLITEEPAVEAKANPIQDIDVVSLSGQPLIKGVISILHQQHQREVNIVVERFSDVSAIVDGMRESIHTVVFEPGVKWMSIESSFVKWTTRGTRYFLYQPNEDIEITGLTKKQDHFEATENGLISVKSSFPIWLGESI